MARDLFFYYMVFKDCREVEIEVNPVLPHAQDERPCALGGESQRLSSADDVCSSILQDVHIRVQSKP